MSAREHPAVLVSQEEARGCGYRKEGGLYLVADSPGEPCGRLPLPCGTCPCCGAGIKPTRGWSWIDVGALVKPLEACSRGSCKAAADTFVSVPLRACPLDGDVERAGLVWVGGRYYKTPEDFMAEAARQGISRRIPHLPTKFELGKTWVLLAHRDCPLPDGSTGPAVFSAFQPRRVDKILRGNETDEEIDKLVKRGLTPVIVERLGEQTSLPGNSSRWERGEQ